MKSIIYLFFSIISLIFVSSCQNKTILAIEQMTKDVNSQCPMQIDGWTTLNSIKLEENKILINYSVDDDVIDALNDDGFVNQTVALLGNVSGNIKKLAYCLQKSDIEVKIYVYSNGVQKRSMITNWYDFMYPTGIELEKIMKEHRDYEQTREFINSKNLFNEL